MAAIRGHGLHLFMYRMFSLPVRLFLRLRCGFRAARFPEIPSPFIVLANHTTDFDMLMVGCRAPQMYFVCGEQVIRRPGLRGFLMRCFAPVIRYKGSSAAGTVIDILRRIRAGYNVCMFPEGNTSFSGVTARCGESTGQLIKKAGCTLVTYRITGGYFTSPRWGRGIRRGRMTGSVAGIHTPEELAQLTANEICTLIYRETYVDAYAEQIKAHTDFIPRGKADGHSAEGIENVLVLCPACRRIGSISGSGDDFYCSCGLHGRYDGGALSGDGVPFTSITAWDDWQKTEFAAAVAKASEYGEPVYENDTAYLARVNTDHTSEPVDCGRLTAFAHSIVIGKTGLRFSDISDMSIHGAGALVLSLHNGGYYEITGVPGRKYLMLYESATGREFST